MDVTPRNIAILAAGVAALAGVVFGLLGYKIGQIPPPAPIVIQLPVGVGASGADHEAGGVVEGCAVGRGAACVVERGGAVRIDAGSAGALKSLEAAP